MFEYYIVLFIILLGTGLLKARPMRVPDFVSQWYYIESIAGNDLIDVYHGLIEVPALVNVQVRSTSKTNDGYIFPGIGIVPRDDDDRNPYSGIVYIYNERKITITALSLNTCHGYQGRTVYAENSEYWTGPNSDSSYSAYVRARAWAKSSLPPPDFHIENVRISAGYLHDPESYSEHRHGLKEYPSMVVVRTKLLKTESPYHGFWSDAVGSALMVYHNVGLSFNGYVIYGFDTEKFRIWTDSSSFGYIFYGEDGTGFQKDAFFEHGDLEIMAWLSSSISPSLVDDVHLGVNPGDVFEKDKIITISGSTENLLVNLWAEATDGPNFNYRFPGSGSLSYSTSATAYPCSYGGLTYAYTNTSLRIWKPGTSGIGKIICIPYTFGRGKNTTQSSNSAKAKLHIWVPKDSNLNLPCKDEEDCFDEHSTCSNAMCQCETGYYDYDNKCHKVLTCNDVVQLIPELERRARNVVYDTEKGIYDYKLKPSWYKATNGFMIPDSSTVPAMDRCGTKYPFYINGTHPSLNTLSEIPLELVACNKDCIAMVTVMVRKCRDDTIHYLLGPLPIEQSGYCVEFDPAPEIGDLHLQLNVELLFDIRAASGDTSIINYTPSLSFNCLPENPVANQSIFYTTYWYIEQKLFMSFGPSSSIEHLTEKMLLDKNQGLDIFMRCAVSASTSKSGLLSRLQTSPEKFYGIKVEPVVFLEKGKSAFVTIEPTAPIGCMYTNRSGSVSTKCKHNFYIVHPDNGDCDLGGLINVQHVRKCSGDITATMVNETWKAGETYTFEVTTEDKNFADGQLFSLTLELFDEHHRIWRGHRINKILVNVTHGDTYKFKQCYSHIDPHMQTADQYQYENQYAGEFVLYRNTKYGIEVQEKTTSCNGQAFCACAVAVRAGGDVFLINRCGGLSFIGFTSCSDGGILEVRKINGLRYQVFTPIGTYINIQMDPHPNYERLLNIDIFLAAKDLGQTEGLCGFFDGDKSNDLKTRNGSTISIQNNELNHHPDFSSEWRIIDGEPNYLLLDPGPIPNWESEKRDMFCYCNASLIQNESVSSEAIAVCSASLFENCIKDKRSVTKKLCSIVQERNRRSAASSYARTETKRRQNLVNKDPKRNVKRQVRAEVNLTEDTARNLCAQMINSQPAVKDFSHRLKSIDAQQLIEECSYDVYEGNDPSWATVYPNVMNQVIEANNERDPDYVKAHKEEVKTFNSLSCPFNCSGNGNCTVEGECECFGQFHGPDCSIDENDELEIDDIEGDGECDLQYGQECQCFHFQTKNLLEQFQCKTAEKLIMVNGTEFFTTTLVESGSYNDIFNGVCCVPAHRTKRFVHSEDVFARELFLSISNNGLNYGSDVNLVVFDSRCQAVNGEIVKLKENTCYISGLCAFENETKSDTCFACLPEINKFIWTNNCPVIESVNHDLVQSFGLIIGVCVGLVLAIVVIVIVVFLVKRKPKRSVSVSCAFDLIAHKEMQYRYKRPNIEMFYAGKHI